MSDLGEFYLLLDLDPDVDDWTVISERIVEKKRQWSKESQGNPKERRRAERSLGLVPKIEAALQDPVQRQEAAAAARRQLAAKRKEQVRELDGAIGVLRSGGGTYTAAQLQRLVKRFGAVFSADEIRKRLRASGVELDSGDAARKPREAREQIDKVTAGQIRRNLEHLGHPDLYGFLGLGRQSSPRALSEKAEEIYNENRRLGKTDTDASAANELAGVCKKVFADDQVKAKYDAYLAVAAMDDLKESIELAGSDGFLTTKEMDELIRQARQRGVSTEDARDYIEAHASRRKWGVQRDAELPSESLQLCGFCSSLAPESVGKCPSCGESLVIECPRCKVKSPSAAAACAQCGCRIGDAPLVSGLLREAERLAIEGALREALSAIEKALHYWPGWQRAEEAKRRFEARRQERESELGVVEKLIRETRLVAARSALARFERAYGARGLDSVQEQVDRGIALAEKSHRAASKCQQAGDAEKALDLYEEALAACADFEPARLAMAASPPPTPLDLQVRPATEGFHLRWRSGATSRRVAYRVRRKTDGVPTGIDDGDHVAEVAQTSLDDTAVPEGVAWHYAVWTVRGGVASHGAASSGPHLRTAEVGGLEAVAADRRITLRWSNPKGCRRVEVWRRESGPPKRPGDGVAVAVAADGAHDLGLTNGKTYGYLVVAVFSDPARAGQELRTRGQTVTATPVAPPAAVADLRCARHGKSVLLTWTPIADATVEVRQTAKLPEYQPGLILPAAQTSRFGKPVDNSTANSAQVLLGAQGRTYFVPLSLAAGTAVVGRAVEVTSLDPVSELTARRAGRGIALTWTWPTGLGEALVCWAYDRHPDDPRTRLGSRALVSRREYDRAGCWMLQLAERQRHYFTVFAKTGELFAEGVQVLESMGQEISVSYQVVVKKKLLRRTIEEAWVELSCPNGDSTTLPAVVVVGKPRSVPLSPRDGRVVAEAPSVRFDSGRAVIPVPREHWRGEPFLKLFFKDADAAREVRLLPAAKERLALR